MKFFISELWYKFRGLFNSQSGIKDTISSINQKGFHVVENFISRDHCDHLARKFDIYSNRKNVWRDDLGSDTRIYGIEILDDEFKGLFDRTYLNKIYKKYISKTRNEFILFNKVRFVDQNIGSGGGWHRDSMHRRQLKFILYLSDANSETGCFQHIDRTHRVWHKFRINMLLGKKFGDHRYSEDNIKELIDNGYQISNLSFDAGSLIIVDSSGIHRGKPIIHGERFALTNYMYDGKIPKHVKKNLVS